MEYKPTVTYSADESFDESLFLTLITHLRKVLQNQPVQWIRSYGRSPHTLSLDIKFLPLTDALLNRTDLVTRPYYHLFWTDCNDIDMYRQWVRTEISTWLDQLKALEISNWMIVVVMGDGSSKLSKPKIPLVRIPVADKIKTDFCSKSQEKIVILHDPLKESSKTADSWVSLASKLATSTISSLEQAVTKYEDRVRTERERRNDKSWNFCSYFILQEELAFVYEMLSLHEVALIQYDELDAMFTQYLLNAHVGDVAHWLSSFMKPVTRWRSLSLWRRIDGESRHRLVDGTASLIDVRNYLFSRHFHLLSAIGDARKITELMHTFLHSSTLELDILEIDMPPGAKDCWVFMNCMEITQSLERLKSKYDNGVWNGGLEGGMNMSNNDLQLEIANLWNLARSKLLNLGELCGLMPDVDTSSENLQVVVDLISGMGDEEERDGLAKPSSLILRNALSSKENFRKEYLELSELAMGTFKHTDRYRFARNLGRDLAEFYIIACALMYAICIVDFQEIGEPAKAESFFLDCVRMYHNEAWPRLNADASERLAKCYKQMCNVRRYVRMCCMLMCNPFLTEEKKSFYCDELCSLSTDFGDNNLPILLAVFASATSIQFNPVQTSIRHKTRQHILLRVRSKAPKPMHFHSLQLSLRHQALSNDDKSPVTETLDEEEERDALTYTTISSDEESNNAEFNGTSSAKQPSNALRRASMPKPPRRRRYLSGNSYDSLCAISQKTPLGPDGTIQLIPIEEPLTEPSKCLANRLPQMIHISYEYEEKEDSILWAGITCRSARQLLRRQDSYQSVCSIHSSTTNIVMEEYLDNLEVTNVTLCPGDNVIEIPVKTAKPGHYTLRQLRFSVNKIHFVLPRILPVIFYTVTKDKPKLTLTPPSRIYCNMVQDIVARLSTEDYELGDDRESRVMLIHFPKHLSIIDVKFLSTQGNDGAEIPVPDPDFHVEETKCSVTLPKAPTQSVITISISCICAQPATHELARRHHRRTQSAPPTTIHKHVQSEHVLLPNAPRAEHVRTKSFANPDIRLPPSPLSKRNVESPVKKFLSFVREVADRAEKKPKPEKTDGSTENGNRLENDEFLEVILDETDGGQWDGGSDKDYLSVNSGSGVSPGYSMEDVINVKSVTPGKLSASLLRNESTKSSVHQRRPLVVHDENPEDDDNKVVCNISFNLPWDEVQPVAASVNFLKLMRFSSRSLRAYLKSKKPESPGALQCVVSVQVENCSPHSFSLADYVLKPSGRGFAVSGLQANEKKKIAPAQKVTFAWKVVYSSTSPQDYSIHFHAEVLSDDAHTHASSVTYKFESDIVQPLYTVSLNIGADGHELVVGEMTTLNITVKRIRRDPEQEHTRGSQQLLMYHVIDTRGRWAVCGKSTGVISVPLSSIETADLGPPVAKASLEIMPLVAGFLHRPVITLQRYLKRRSGEFDEQLSSTESPVLKPPKLMDFRPPEIVHIDEYKQVRIVETACQKSLTETAQFKKTKF